MRRTTDTGNAFESEVDNQPFDYIPSPPPHFPFMLISFPLLKKWSSSVFRLHENLFSTLVSAKGSDYVTCRSNSENTQLLVSRLLFAHVVKQPLVLL